MNLCVQEPSHRLYLIIDTFYFALAPSSYFVTVAVTGPNAPHNPGDTEYQIASELSDYLAHAARGTPRLGLMSLLEEYMAFQADRIFGDETYTQTWFDPLIMNEQPESNRTIYTCDKQLGSPNAVDCEHVLYSQLGYPNDILTLSPGTGKTISSSEFLFFELFLVHHAAPPGYIYLLFSPLKMLVSSRS